MKTINHHSTSRNRLLHIETDGCIVNIRCGLTDMDGHDVTSVEILADQYKGEEWDLDGHVNNRVIRRSIEA